MLYRGKRVVVYGETEGAELEANYLKEIGCIVIYVSRRAESGRLKDTIPYLRIREMKIFGDGKVDYVLIDGEKVLCDGVFLLRPAVSPVDLIAGLAVENGHIRVNGAMETNLPGVYACGDCTGQPYQIARAAGQGQIAALHAVSWLDRQG